HKAIRKSGFKNPPGHGGKGNLKTHIQPSPGLVLIFSLEQPECFGILSVVPETSLCSQNFYKPGIGFSWCQPLHFQSHGNVAVVDLHRGGQRRIGPRIAFCPTTPGIGSSRYYFLKLGINPYRIPAQSKWNMQHVHSKISHDTYFTAILRLSFPVDGFQRVHITRVVKSGVYFDDLTQRAGFDLPDQSLWPGQERHLRTAPDKSTSLYRQLPDRGRCMEIDPKRLFGKKILARL